MKKVLLYTAILSLCFNTVSASDTLKISAFSPSIWVQKQGDLLTGPIIELLEEIFAELNLKVTSVALPFHR